MNPNLGRVGIFSGELRFSREREAAKECAAEIEQLGFGCLWIPGGTLPGAFEVLDEAFAATTEVPIASAIISIWVEDADAVAEYQRSCEESRPGRFLLGLGTSHVPLVEESQRARLARPRTEMIAYLDRLDAALAPEPPGPRVLAALGPRMLELSRERFSGAHPYLVPPAHTAAAREALGPGPLLAPQQAVVLESDPERARAIARANLAGYFDLPNYTRNWLRFGFEEADLAGGGSDRLIDGLVAWGDQEAVAARVAEHLQAGADHVALMAMQEAKGFPREQWRRLAPLVERFGQ